MGITANLKGLDPSTWTNARAANIDGVITKSEDDVTLLLDFERDPKMQFYSDFMTFTTAGAGGSMQYNPVKAALAIIRGGADYDVDFDDFKSFDDPGASNTITITWKIRLSAENNGLLMYFLYQDANNKMGFQVGAANLDCLTFKAGASEAQSVALTTFDMTDNIWLRIVLTGAGASLDGYYSTDGSNFTQIGSQMTTQIPTLAAAYPRVESNGANRELYIKQIKVQVSD